MPRGMPGSSLLGQAFSVFGGRSEEPGSSSNAADDLDVGKRRSRPPERHRLVESPPPGGPVSNGKRRRGGGAIGRPRVLSEAGSSGAGSGLAPIALPEADSTEDLAALDGAFQAEVTGSWHGRHLADGMSPGASTPGSAMREIRARRRCTSQMAHQSEAAAAPRPLACRLPRLGPLLRPLERRTARQGRTSPPVAAPMTHCLAAPVPQASGRGEGAAAGLRGGRERGTARRGAAPPPVQSALQRS
jgi:hypothetical protein